MLLPYLIDAMKLIGLMRARPRFSAAKPPSATLADLFPAAQDLPADALLAAEKKLMSRSRQVLQDNRKVRNYLYHEYYRGEDFIEKIPIMPSEQYTIADQRADMQNNERLSIEEVEPISNHVERARIIREKIAAYHDKQRKYEVEEFEKYLSKYPGTTKGPRPEDDWEAYRAYGLKKIPKIILDEIHQENAEKKEKAKREFDYDREDDIELNEPPRIHSPSTLLAYMSKDRDLVDNTIEDVEIRDEDNNDDFMGEWGNQQMIEDHKPEVPTMPNLAYENYQHFMNHWMSWIHFRNYYIGHNMASNLIKLEQKVLRLSQSMDDNPAEPYMELPANIPSLYRYYKCLPKSLQDHPGLKDIYLGLEYTSPDFTYDEKEEAINWTCPLLLPFDDSTPLPTQSPPSA